MQVRSFIAGLITVVALGVFGYTLVNALWYNPEAELDIPEGPITAPLERPARLQIPSLSIDAKVFEVGIAKSGRMAVPPNYTDVGWYKLGTVPGQMGSAVIDGHVDNGFGLPAVFKRLGELTRGDDVYIETKEGKRLHFEVIAVENYKEAEVPKEHLFTANDAQYLNLITCDGAFDRGTLSYSNRLIVYTQLVAVED